METKLYVANRVREIRSRLKMRQQDLADQVGVSRQTIISIERGRLFNPTVHTCLMLSRILREPVDYLFYLVPQRSSQPDENQIPDVEESIISDEEPLPADTEHSPDAISENSGWVPETPSQPDEKITPESMAIASESTPSSIQEDMHPHIPSLDPSEKETNLTSAENDSDEGTASAQAVWDFSRI